MSATEPRTLRREQRELLRGLSRGADLDDLGWALNCTIDEVHERARDALVELAGPPPEELPIRSRVAIGDYLLGRQSPGQAAGTWALLEGDDAAREWAARLREGLGALSSHAPPPVPGDGAPSPAERVRRTAQTSATPLARRRAQRARRRTAANIQAAAAQVTSPFRAEALEAQREADERIRLPRFASRPARLTLYGLLTALLAGLVFAILVRIPTHAPALVLVADVPAGAPVTQQGLAAIALFDRTSGARLEPGQTLRVQLPDTPRRVSMRVTEVVPRILSPREMITSFDLEVGQANRMTTPAIVVVAELTVPENRAAESFEGAVTTDADARTGSRRLISLLDVF